MTTDTQQKILRLLAESERTLPDIATALGISRTAARAALHVLKASGHITTVGVETHDLPPFSVYAVSAAGAAELDRIDASPAVVTVTLDDLANLLALAAAAGRRAADTWGDHTESGIAATILHLAGLIPTKEPQP